MKKFLIIMCLSGFGTAYADTINLQWLAADNTTFQNSTCTTGGDLNVPSTTPTKYGYDFVGWRARAARELEYVTFQLTTMINTGVKFDSNDIEYEIKLAFPYNQPYKVAFASEGACAGANNFTANSAGALFVTGSMSGRIFKIGSRSISFTNGTNGGIETYTMYINKTSGSIVATLGDTVYNSTIAGTISADKDILMGGPQQNCDMAGGKIYYFKITKDGTLVRDFIPALDPDGVACFYDRVTKTFFYPDSNGANLIAGPLKE